MEKYCVLYMPTREGRIFAGLKPEVMGSFDTQEEAQTDCNSQTHLDELHSGYVVRKLIQVDGKGDSNNGQI